MNLELLPFRLQLARTFGISRERYDHRDTLVVALTRGEHTGYGEATAHPYYGITTDSMQREITERGSEIERFGKVPPEAFESWLQSTGLSNFARCALDMAYHDLFGKESGKPLFELWDTPPKNLPVTNYTIGLDRPEIMVEKIKEKPWPVYKIKLGTPDDVRIIRELRKYTDSPFRVDANGAWSAGETIENARVLKDLGVEFIEQPLPAADWEGMERVAHRSVLPVIADESCIVEADVDRCALHFHGINIKLSKCGGLSPARRMIRKARDYGLQVMVGCMTESTVGISAIAQLLPQLDYVDMDGAMLLKSDIATGVRIDDSGRIIYPDGGGTGVLLTGA